MTTDIHDERRRYPLECACGYIARDRADLLEHIEHATRASNPPRREQRNR